MRQSILLLGALVAVAGCNQSAEQPPANTLAAKAAEPAKKRPTYCFFKNADTKGWAAARDASGKVTVEGQARIADRRYRASLGEPDIEGGKAKFWLTMAPNTTGMGAPDDWWDVNAAVPAGATVDSVTILCGRKTVAELPLKKG